MATLYTSTAAVTTGSPFGNGSGDVALFGIICSNDKFIFGNGSGDRLSVVSSTNDSVTIGNGAADSVTLYLDAGGDTIITGTGAGDTVLIYGGPRTPDTFGFSLGTNGSSYTTITGAQAGDFVITARHNLADPYVNEGNVGAGALATLLAEVHNNTTLIGNDGGNTFIVTDVGGKIGDIEIVGVFSGTVMDHVLTLHT